MFLRDFRPVSFEFNGKPLKMTMNGILMDTKEVEPADTNYNSGDRTSLISISTNYTVDDNKIENLIDGSGKNVKLHVQDNNPEDGDFIFLSFAKSQNFDKITFITKDWEYTPVVNIYCSDDQLNWFILGDVILTKDETKLEIDIKMPLGNFKYFKIGSKSEDTYDVGYMRNIEFNIIDNPVSQEIIRSISKENSTDDDFDKIDSYIGTYFKSNNELFDKYNYIDEILGKIYDDSASTVEIALVGTLNEQFGILAELDDDLVNYIDMKLGLQ